MTILDDLQAVVDAAKKTRDWILRTPDEGYSGPPFTLLDDPLAALPEDWRKEVEGERDYWKELWTRASLGVFDYQDQRNQALARVTELEVELRERRAWSNWAEARIAELEAALREIAEHGPYIVKNNGAYHVEVSTTDLQDIARRALGEKA